MANKQIHELSALPSTPATGNVLAIDTGTTTYKIDYNTLATAIINKLGGDPVTVAHGGTGANSISAAMNSLAVSMYFNADNSTLASIYPKLTTIPTGYSSMVWLHPTPARLLSNNKTPANIYASGVVARTSASGFRIEVFTDGGEVYIWTITNWSSASATPTIGTVYKLQGTAV